MRFRYVRVVAASALLSIGCGGGGSSGSVAPPTAPSVPAGLPATVNVGGNSAAALGWNGTASDDQGGSGPIQVGLHQSGAQVTGSLYVQVLGHSGPFTGTISGNTISFNFSVGNSGNGCGNAISGVATVSSVNTMTARPNTMNTMTATFSGKDCSGNPVTNGAFTVSLQDPTLPDQTASATRFPIAGTWQGFLPPPFGGGSWTWKLAQDGDVNGGNLSGSVTVSSDNTLNLGIGTVAGTVTNVFPGPPENMTASANVSFTGACPATLTMSWGNLTTTVNSPALTQDGLQLQNAANVTGSTCNGPVQTAFKPLLKRQ